MAIFKHSKKISAGARVYYLDIMEDTGGNDMLSVTEINPVNKKRYSLYIYPEHLGSLIESLRVMDGLLKESLQKVKV